MARITACAGREAENSVRSLGREGLGKLRWAMMHIRRQK